MDFYDYNVIFDPSDVNYDLMDPKVLQENYNTTVNDVWQFVPAISRGDEPHFVICLIWTMPIEYQLASDLIYEVSCFLVFAYFKISNNYLMMILFINDSIFSLKSLQVIFLL